MTSITLTLEEIREAKLRARREGKHNLVRYLEDLERRAERESESEAGGG